MTPQPHEFFADIAAVGQVCDLLGHAGRIKFDRLPTAAGQQLCHALLQTLQVRISQSSSRTFNDRDLCFDFGETNAHLRGQGGAFVLSHPLQIVKRFVYGTLDSRRAGFVQPAARGGKRAG